MPAPELHYFNWHYERGTDWYASHFADAGGDQIVGEKSASYLADSRVPSRIHDLLPGVRLIVQLRNPIERAYSDYCMLLRRGEVGADVARYLDPDSTPVRRFVDHGLYGRHLSAFLAVFPREQVKILLYDDIARDPEQVYAEIVRFVGLADPMPLDHVASRVKDKATPMLPLPLRRALRPLKDLVRPLRSNATFKRAHGMLARPVAYPPLGEATREKLAAYYASDVAALGKLIDRDLAHWLRPEADRA
jgi:Sulfotransferase family